MGILGKRKENGLKKNSKEKSYLTLSGPVIHGIPKKKELSVKRAAGNNVLELCVRYNKEDTEKDQRRSCGYGDPAADKP